ncbi:hypothetical protein QAD02_002012 [Eretmocerus hayati]|uniref:Uncharacterized protein n=1 Tax=Eretmocerus hayati TaxID=131215 RepID=A0ACC2NIM5_9HYME|nr:hypothetical protein QAD02_002012 [Eretmocerus hayati]
MRELNTHGVWRACNKIRSAVTRIPINLWDQFNPLDKQKKNLVSELDFIKVLTGPTGKSIGLSDQEVCELSDYFRAQDGRIHYAQFCTIIHEESSSLGKNLPWTSGEEWEDPLQTNCLSPSEERRVKIIIAKIASVINSREIVLKPYFQDYELVSQNCGVVTFTHFARILRFLDVILGSEEAYLLFKKFAKDNYTVNYVAFIEAVDEAKRFLYQHNTLDEGGDLLEEFPGKALSVNLPKLPRPEVDKLKSACVFPKQLHFLSVDTSSKRVREIEEVMLRIQDYVLKNRLRVKAYFQDFDVFNVGKISPHQFKRGLDNLRNYPLGRLYLGETEIENLITFYGDPNDMERVCWRIFEDDVEQVFTVKNLDKHPNCKVLAPPREVRFLPRKGFQEWECTEMMCKDAMEKKFEKTMKKVEHRVKGRRMALRPFFRDLDKNHRGHVSRSQLRRVLAVGSIPLTAEEILSLEYMFNNDDGFNYSEFMNRLEKLIGDSSSCEQDKLKSGKTSQHEENMYDTANHSIDFILSKIKANIVSKGIKVRKHA